MGNSGTLMDRAKLLLKPGTAATISIIPLATAIPEARATNPQFSLTQSFVSFGTGGAFTGPRSITGTIDPTLDTIKMSGGAGPIAGANWTQDPSLPLLFLLLGTDSAQPEHGDFLHVNYDFQVAFSGGEIDWEVRGSHGVRTSPQVNGFFAVAAGTTNSPGTHDLRGSISSAPWDSLGSTTLMIDTSWSLWLTVYWSDFTATDTIQITVPSGSIDLFYNVPEPSAVICGFLGIPLGLLRRARRPIDVS